MTTGTAFDAITMGGSSIGLYSNGIGSPFGDIGSLAECGVGSPTNIAVGCRRLGKRAGLLTAVDRSATTRRTRFCRSPDARAAPRERMRALEISGTGQSGGIQGPSTLSAAERASCAGANAYLDLDFREDPWADPLACGAIVVGRHACANSMGIRDEVLQFASERGGLWNAATRDPGAASSVGVRMRMPRPQGRGPTWCTDRMEPALRA